MPDTCGWGKLMPELIDMIAHAFTGREETRTHALRSLIPVIGASTQRRLLTHAAWQVASVPDLRKSSGSGSLSLFVLFDCVCLVCLLLC